MSTTGCDAPECWEQINGRFILVDSDIHDLKIESTVMKKIIHGADGRSGVNGELGQIKAGHADLKNHCEGIRNTVYGKDGRSGINGELSQKVGWWSLWTVLTFLILIVAGNSANLYSTINKVRRAQIDPKIVIELNKNIEDLNRKLLKTFEKYGVVENQ